MSGKLRTSPADNGRMMANPSGCMQCEVLDQCLLLADEDVSRGKSPGKRYVTAGALAAVSQAETASRQNV